jgi:hypothetical protein
MKELPSMVWSLRTTPSPATGFTPFFLVYRAEAVTEPPKSLGPPTVVLVQQTSDNPVDVPESLDKFGIFSLTFPGTFHPSDRQYVHWRCGNAEVIT